MAAGINQELGDAVVVHSIDGKDRAWHGMGIPISEEMGAEEAGDKHGLLTPVRALRLRAYDPADPAIEVEIEDRVANVRFVPSPNGEGNLLVPVGIVSKDYSVCPDRDLAQTMDMLAEESGGECVVESCGVIDSGKRVFFCARYGSFGVGGDEDRVWKYVIGSNSHNATSGIRFDLNNTRIVCCNTWRMVVGDESGYKPAAWSMSHTGDVRQKIGEVRAALKHFAATGAREEERAAELSARPVDDDLAMGFFADLYCRHFPVPEGEGISRRSRTLRENRQNNAAAAFLSRFRRESQQFGGSNLWIALNAYTGTIQHDMITPGADDEARQNAKVRANLFGVNVRRSHDAYSLALETLAASAA
jgi:hypothetical protein